MVTPILHEGMTKRDVYVPEDMELIRFDGYTFTNSQVRSGWQQIDVPVNEVVFFKLPEESVKVTREAAKCTRDIHMDDLIELQYKATGVSWWLYYINTSYIIGFSSPGVSDISHHNILHLICRTSDTRNSKSGRKSVELL